jgi:hypothetical protein
MFGRGKSVPTNGAIYLVIDNLSAQADSPLEPRNDLTEAVEVCMSTMDEIGLMKKRIGGRYEHCTTSPLGFGFLR